MRLSTEANGVISCAFFCSSSSSWRLLGWFSLSESVSSFDSAIDSLSLSDKIPVKLELTEKKKKC
jgi:hypothetical protein